MHLMYRRWPNRAIYLQSLLFISPHHCF